MRPFPDLTTAARALQDAFSDAISVLSLSVIGEGFSSLVVETPSGVVFRIARTPEAGARYAREIQLLPLLAPYLPVAIPAPRWHLPGSDIFPFGVIGYPRLAGRPLDFDDFTDPSLRSDYAAQMAALLAKLHQIPVQRFPLEDQWPDLYHAWQEQRAVVMPELSKRLPAVEIRLVESWWEQFLADKSLRDYPAALVHGDFWFGNLLVEENRISGLLDFENLAVGDPAGDFVPLLYMGEDFMRQALASYRTAGGAVDPGFDHRLGQLWAIREFGGLAYAVRYQDAVEFEDGLLKLYRGPIFNRGDLDGWGKDR